MNNGNFETRNTGGAGYPNRLRFEWWLIEQDIASNRSRVGFKLFGTGGTAPSAWVKLFKAYANVAGQTWSTGAHNLSNGTILVQGDKWIGHNADGTGWFEAYADGAIYKAGYNSFGKASWNLPTIPRASQPSIKTFPNNTPDFNLGETITVHMNAVNGAFRHTVYFLYGDKTYKIAENVSANCQFNTDLVAEDIYKIATSKKAYSGQIKVDTFLNGNLTGSKTCHYNVHLVDVEPTFTDFTYFDSNGTTKAITGNDQVFIQGQSRLSVKIAKEKKAEAKKYATMTKYLASAFGISVTKNYSATSDVQIDIGAVNASTNQIVSVSAIDSREFTTTKTKNIAVIPYSRPTLNVSAGRKGNFENETIVKISGNITSLKIGSIEKNGVLSLKCRSKSSMGSDFGPAQNVPFTIGSDMILRVPDFHIALDNTLKHTLEFEVIDKLSSVKVYVEIDVGIPIFRISTKTKKLYNNEERVLTERDTIPANKIQGPVLVKFSATATPYGVLDNGKVVYRRIIIGNDDIPSTIPFQSFTQIISATMTAQHKSSGNNWRTIPWLYNSNDTNWSGGFVINGDNRQILTQIGAELRKCSSWCVVVDFCVD
ncbi:hypothetical protein HG470_001575 [Candidatus Saccharibacteria bacterium]|nr:hypothetical protein [Candidatus Saccharibacteria bacterium]